jgi:fatty acid desaturase
MRLRVDWRTFGVAIIILGGFALWSLYFTVLPLWLGAPLGSVLLTWYGSLQHETIHGHPTASKRVNSVIGGMPLSLWVPYVIYRRTHIQHHQHSGRRLTEVGHDPESFYLPPGHLASVGGIRRALLQANCTLAGRILLGPAIAICAFWAEEARKAGPLRSLVAPSDRHARLDAQHRRIWLRHAIGVAAVLVWIGGVCHIPLLTYLLLVVYPSISLTHLRSFAEHRADDHSQLRTNVVEAHPFWALIFLNNNLHVAHHAHPHVQWYELPRVWREMRQSRICGGRVFRGYGDVARQYLLRPFITAEHPLPRVRLE